MMIKTTTDVIKALGGYQAVADRYGFDYQRVWRWGKENSIPARAFVRMKAELRKLGHDAPDDLWKMW